MGRLGQITNVILSASAIALVVRAYSPSSNPPVGTPLQVVDTLQDEEWSQLLDDGHWIGDSSARVVIVEFMDFQCPYCRRFALDVVKPLQVEFQGDLAIVFRNWPLDGHAAALPFALASECAAAQGRLNEFQSVAFELQDSLPMLVPYFVAKRAGVDDSLRFSRCVQSDSTAKRVQRDIELAKRFGSGGTPSVIINGVRYPGGGPTLAEIRDLLQDAR